MKKIELDKEDPDEVLDWDLEERDRWIDENDGDIDDPTEIAIEADE